jgi:hypothetical protein
MNRLKPKRVYSLETQHKLKLTELNEIKRTIRVKRDELIKLETEYQVDTDTLEIDTLKGEIRSLSNTYITQASEYYKKAGVVLHEYFNKNLVDRTNSEQDTQEHNINVEGGSGSGSGQKHQSLGMVSGFIKNHKNQIGVTNGKKSLMEQYMTTVSNDYELTIHELPEQDTCEICGFDMSDMRNDAEIVCVNCGHSEHLIIDSDRKSYKDSPPDMVYYAYKRMNHFNELMQQFQGKENNISADVYTAIRDDLDKKQFTQLDKLTPKFMRSILKKLNLSGYYSNIPHIIHKLNGKPILILTPEQDNQLRQMFTQLQEPFKDCCPTNRSNWPHYHYTFYKMFELLSLDQFLHCFPLLKNHKLVYKLDKIWKCMCTKLNWEFIQTGRD